MAIDQKAKEVIKGMSKKQMVLALLFVASGIDLVSALDMAIEIG